jgi:predicted dehydrogenase
MTTKRLGFVDYKLGNFHANEYLKLLRGELKPRGWEVAKCWGTDEATGRKWAADKGVPYAASVDAMADCDAMVILAPSNPEVHLELARKVFPLGKPTYVDKTFAPDHETALRIFHLADQHRVPVITTSALRCAASLNQCVAELGREKVRHLRAWGGGRSFEEYVIHPLEMVISTMGPQVEKVLHLADGDRHHELHLSFSGGRTASVFVHSIGACAFQAMVTTDEKTVCVDASADPIFRDLAGFILDFFESGRESIDRAESLAIFKVLDVAFDLPSIGKFVNVQPAASRAPLKLSPRP